MVGPAGLGFPNKINSLGRPTPQNRVLFLEDNFARCPTCPTLPEAEAPLLDAWLASEQRPHRLDRVAGRAQSQRMRNCWAAA